MSWKGPAPGPGANRRSSAGYLTLAKNIFDPFEERLLVRIRLVVQLFLGKRASEFLEQVLLFFGEFLRHGDACDDVQIASAAAVHVRHAFAAQFESGSGLRAGRYVQILTAIERRHLDMAAERERGKTDRHLTVEIVFL